MRETLGSLLVFVFCYVCSVVILLFPPIYLLNICGVGVSVKSLLIFGVLRGMLDCVINIVFNIIGKWSGVKNSECNTVGTVVFSVIYSICSLLVPLGVVYVLYSYIPSVEQLIVFIVFVIFCLIFLVIQGVIESKESGKPFTLFGNKKADSVDID